MEGISGLCSLPCKACKCILVSLCCSSPISCYDIVTLVVNIPILVVGIQGMIKGPPCESNQVSLWLLIMVIFSPIHIVASLYLTARLHSEKIAAKAESYSLDDRMGYMICNDSHMMVYLLVWMFYFVWVVVGAVWYLESLDCPAMAICLGFGAFYIVAAISGCILPTFIIECMDIDYEYEDNRDYPYPETTTTTNSTPVIQPMAATISKKEELDEPLECVIPQATVATAEDSQIGDLPVAYAETVPTAPMEDQEKTMPFKNP